MGDEAIRAIKLWQSADVVDIDGMRLVFDGLWPEHAAAFEAFLAVSTQWRTTQIGGGMAPVRTIYVGLDYAAVRAGLDGFGIAQSPTLWQSLRIIEAAARDALNARL